MSWLETQVSVHGHTFESQMINALNDAGVYDSIFRICGFYGVRRFVIRFEYTSQGIRVNEIENLPLHYGGGAPTNATRELVDVLRQNLNTLYRSMAPWASWQKGLFGVVRNCDNEMQVIPFFNEDADAITVEHLPIPPQGHPLEHTDYTRLRASMAAQLEPVLQNTYAISHDWMEWAIDDNVLTLVYADEYEQYAERKRCRVLGTFDATGTWAWQVSEPLFSEEVFCWEHFVCDWDSAVELGMVCTARLNGTWLFFSLVSEDPQVTLLVAVWD